PPGRRRAPRVRRERPRGGRALRREARGTRADRRARVAAARGAGALPGDPRGALGGARRVAGAARGAPMSGDPFESLRHALTLIPLIQSHQGITVLELAARTGLSEQEITKEVGG